MIRKVEPQEFAKIYIECWIRDIIGIDKGTVKVGEDTKNIEDIWAQYKMWTNWHRENILCHLAIELGYLDRNCCEEVPNTECVCKDICQNRNNGKKCYEYFMQNEYYRVDFTLYNHMGKQSYWALDYAIEHENDEFRIDKNKEVSQKGWFDEFAKLLPLKCARARVIIGYDKFKYLDDKIQRCTDLIKFWQEKDKKGEDNSLSTSPIILIIFTRNAKYVSQNSKNVNCDEIIKIIEFKNGSLERCDITEKVVNDSESIKQGLIDAYKKIAGVV